MRARLRQEIQSQPGLRATWQRAVFMAFAVATPTLKTSAADDVIQYVAPQQVCIIDCNKINESSGLAASHLRPHVFWTHNDSGDKPCLYAFDETGKHLGTCDVEGAKAKDWEDMASFNLDGNACLLVGDVGDNRGKRETCELYLIEEVAPDEEKLVVRQTVRYSYDRGPQDCESIGFDTTTRQVLFVSKNWTRTAQVFVLEWPAETDEVQTARFIGEINVPGATAMDISPDGRRAVVLCYGDAYEFTRQPGETWEVAFSRKERKIKMPARRQGETLCFGTDGRTLFLTSEKHPTPFFRVPPSL